VLKGRPFSVPQLPPVLRARGGFGQGRAESKAPDGRRGMAGLALPCRGETETFPGPCLLAGKQSTLCFHPRGMEGWKWLLPFHLRGMAGAQHCGQPAWAMHGRWQAANFNCPEAISRTPSTLCRKELTRKGFAKLSLQISGFILRLCG